MVRALTQRRAFLGVEEAKRNREIDLDRQLGGRAKREVEKV